MKTWLVRALGVALVAFSLVAGWFAVTARIAHDQFVHCQVGVTDQIVAVLNARTTFAERDRVALQKVFLDVTNSTTREQTLAALTRYNATVAATDVERQAMQLPQPPSRACDADRDNN